MTETLNTIAGLWWGWTTAMFWQVGLLIALIAVADRLIRRRAWPQLRYALWSLVLIKLLLPPSLSLPSGIVPGLQPVVQQVLHRLDTEKPAAGEGRILVTVNEEMLGAVATESPAAGRPAVWAGSVKAAGLGDGSPIDRQNNPQERGPAASSGVAIPRETTVAITWQVYLMATWLAGTLTFGIWLFIRLRSLADRHASTAAAASLPQPFYNRLADCAKRLELRHVPEVVVTKQLASPAVFGVFRPVLLMPSSSLRTLSPRDTEHVLLHELAHIKRGDLVMHSLYMLLQIAYWYNPLLWLVRRQLHHLRELSCDATVANLLREQTAAYRRTLLETARRLLAASAEPGLGLLGLFEDSNRLAIRLSWLTKPTWRYRTMKRAIVLTIAAMMIACVLPMARAQKLAAIEETPVIDKENAQLSQELASLEARLQELMVQQQQLQAQLRVLAARRNQIRAEDAKPKRTGSVVVVPSSEAPAPRSPVATDTLSAPSARAAAPRNQAPQSGPGPQEVARRRAQQARALSEISEKQEWAVWQQQWAEQMRQWQQSEEMKQWRQQIEEWAKEQAKAYDREEMYQTDRTAGSTPPPMPPMPPMPSPPDHARTIATSRHQPYGSAGVSQSAATDGHRDLPHGNSPHVIVRSRSESHADSHAHATVPQVTVPTSGTAAPMPGPMPGLPPTSEATEQVVPCGEFVVKSLPDGGVLRVVNAIGSIAIEGGKGRDCTIEATARIAGVDRAEAERIAEGILGRIAPADGVVDVRMELPEDMDEALRNRIRIDLRIVVPHRANLQVTQKVGDVCISSVLGNVKANVEVGSIRASRLQGDAALRTNVGEITFTTSKDLSAKVRAQTQVGSISSDLPLEITSAAAVQGGDARDALGSHASGTLGAGQHKIDLITNVGSVRIHSQSSQPSDSVL